MSESGRSKTVRHLCQKHRTGIDPEIHNEEELGHCYDEISMLGVNNRNLKTFEVDINTSLNLISKIPAKTGHRRKWDQ